MSRKLLNSADFKNRNLKGPHQTPVKWIRDKKNMVDPKSYHVIKYKEKAYNVPMPICSSKYFVSITAENVRAKKKQANNKSRQVAMKDVEETPPLEKNKQPVADKPISKKRKAVEETPTVTKKVPQPAAKSIPTPITETSPTPNVFQQFFSKISKQMVPSRETAGNDEYTFVLDVDNNNKKKRLVTVKSTLIDHL